MNDFGFEIDFLPVGSGERSGDAIVVRYGEPGAYKIMVYDGGTKASGESIVEHINTHFGTNHVDFVVNSHPDGDHASGLSVVMEKMTVGELWMHKPWDHSHLICEYFADGRITSNSLAARLQDKMGAAYSLEKIADDKGVPVYEPFTGSQIGAFFVCSPTKEWYVHTLVPEFEKSPDQKSVQPPNLFVRLSQKAITWISEQWGAESLRENVVTSAENDSSVALYAHIKGEGILLTGDIGVRGLNAIADFLESHGISPASVLKFIQIPHHGSRNNVSTSTLDRIVGPRLSVPGQPTKVAYVSASTGSSTHPRKSVINAFIRRGADVVLPSGWTICYSRGMPDRGWKPVSTADFSNQVESWD
jgi:beta-lactamase superfamily II metal-dependent hydrolase